MKRSMTATLGGEEIKLVASFGAASEIASKIGDPLMIVREITVSSEMAKSGIGYTSKWQFGVKNLPVMLHIGMRAAGDKRGLAEVQDMVFGAGFIEAQSVCIDYLMLLVTPQNEEQMEAGETTTGE